MPNPRPKKKKAVRNSADSVEKAIHSLHELSLTALQTFRVLKPLLKQLKK